MHSKAGRDTDVLVVNSTKGDSYIDAAFAHPVDPIAALDHRTARDDARLAGQRAELAARLNSGTEETGNGDISWRA